MKRKHFTYLLSKKSLLWCVLILSISINLLGQGWRKDINTGFNPALNIVEAENGDIVGSLLELSEWSNLIMRLDSEGNEVWSFPIDTAVEHVSSIVKSLDNNFIIAYGVDIQDTIHHLRVKKFDNNGNLIWENLNATQGVPIALYSGKIITSHDGGVVITGRLRVPYPLQSSFVLKLDANGNYEWMQSYDWTHQWNTLVEANNGDIVLAGGGINLMRLNSMGDSLWRKSYNIDEGVERAVDLIQTQNNGFAIFAYRNLTNNGGWPANNDLHQSVIIKVNNNGEIQDFNFIPGETYSEWLNYPFRYLHQRVDGGYDLLNNRRHGEGMVILQIAATGEIINTINYGDIYGRSFIPHSSGGYVISGGLAHNFIIRTNTQGEFVSKVIHGNLFNNNNASCEDEPTELGLVNWLVSIENTATNETRYATTDADGNYSIYVNEGTYEVTAQISSAVWEPCQEPTPTNPQIVTLNESVDTAIVNFPINPVFDCPIMTVNIAAPLLRRCYDNTYYVQYCNEGTETAINAYLEVTLDDYFDADSLSASIPYIDQGESLLFPVGDVAVDECGQFSIQAYLDCNTTVTGQTHCSEARVFPEPWCLPIHENWDESSIAVEGECDTEVVRFSISNEGSGDMSDSLNYFVIVDELIMLQGKFKLGSGEVQEVEIAAESQTYRLCAEQAPFHPGSSMPNAAVEGCPDFGSLGFITMFPQNDEDPNVDIDCQENIASFDPNDKQAFPRGYGTSHQIEPETDLEYLIRFQNTGTDTAFRVVVRDTFSQHLDLSTFRMDVASHLYEWEIFGTGVLKVTFENIMLPDSNVNEAASHGFFKYSIRPKVDVPLGTKLENRAGIYFDYNEPVLTNTVFHTIDKGFIDDGVSVHEVANQTYPIEVFPNPFAEATIFKLPQNFKRLELEIFDVMGRKVGTVLGSGIELSFERQDLEAGIYFFNLRGDEQYLWAGKLVLE